MGPVWSISWSPGQGFAQDVRAMVFTMEICSRNILPQRSSNIAVVGPLTRARDNRREGYEQVVILGERGMKK